MTAWAVHGVELPFGDQARSWWVDAAGSLRDRPIAGAEPLPGRFILPGLADAHAHPAVGCWAGGPGRSGYQRSAREPARLGPDRDHPGTRRGISGRPDPPAHTRAGPAHAAGSRPVPGPGGPLLPR